MRTAVPPLVALLLAGPAAAAGPVCAFLDPGGSDRGPLVEAALLADGAATWVDRAAVDRVLKEQHLQAAFAPDAVGRRVALGKVLKADVLALVRPAGAGAGRVLEVVVCETGRGLRLTVGTVPLTADPKADALAAAAVVRTGVARHGAGVKTLVAVPPFGNRTLTGEFDHLRAALAKVAEGAAAARPGVLAVELAEAEAVAKELALAAPADRLTRPPPVFLLGEFKLAPGGGPGRKLVVALKAEQWAAPVGVPAELTVTADQAPAAVLKWATATVDAAAGLKGLPAADAATEARALATRATDLRRLGNWAESHALLEAALLLDPAPVDRRADVLVAFAEVFGGETGGPTEEGVRRAAGAYGHALGHFEAVCREPDAWDHKARAVGAWAAAARTFDALTGGGPPAARELAADAHAAERARLTALLPVVATFTQVHTEVLLFDRISRGLPPKERYALVEKYVIEFRPNRYTDFRLPAYLNCFGSQLAQDGPEYRGLLDRLAANPSYEIKDAAEKLKAKLGAALRLKARGPADRRTYPEPPSPRSIKPAPPSPGPVGVRFEPVGLRGSGRPLLGAAPAGAGVDVFWSDAAVYTMAEKGVLREAVGPRDGFGRPTAVVFDGRYVWAAGQRRHASPTLAVIDPTTGKAWTAADGVPAPADARADGQTLLVAPVGPGRACVAGSFGGRGWVGVAAFDPAAGRVAVTVIHEAVERADGTVRDDWRRPTIGFIPSHMATLRGPDGATRVLVGRGGAGDPFGDHPLVIDPDRRAVSVSPERVVAAGATSQTAAAVDALFFVDKEIEAGPQHGPAETLAWLCRITFPAARKEVLAAGLPLGSRPGTTVVHDGRVHVVRHLPAAAGGCKWWAGRPGGEIWPVGERLPAVGTVAATGHYGLIAFVALGGDPADPTVCTAIVPDRPPAPAAPPVDPVAKWLARPPKTPAGPYPFDKVVPLPPLWDAPAVGAGPVAAVAFTPDGSKLAVAWRDRSTIPVLDARTGLTLGTFAGHTGKVVGVGPRGDGTMISLAVGEPAALVWRPDTLAVVGRFDVDNPFAPGDEPVGVFAVSGNGRFAVAGKFGKPVPDALGVPAWEPAPLVAHDDLSAERITNLSRVRSFPPGLVRFRPHGSGGGWDLQFGVDDQVSSVGVLGRGGTGTSGGVLPKGARLVGMSPTMTRAVWVVPADTLRKRPAGHRLVDLGEPREVATTTLVPAAGVEFTPDGERWCGLRRTAAGDELVVFDAWGGEPLASATLTPATGGTPPASGWFGPDGAAVVTWRPGVGLQAFRVPSALSPSVVPPGPPAPRPPGPLPPPPPVLALLPGGTLTPRAVHNIPPPPRTPPPGRAAAGLDAAPTLAPAWVWRSDAARLAGVAFTPDGSKLAVAWHDRSAVDVLDGLTGRPLGAFAGHTGKVVGVAPLANATFVSLAVGEPDALVWDPATRAATGKLPAVNPFAPGDDPAGVFAASADGRFVVSGKLGRPLAPPPNELAGPATEPAPLTLVDTTLGRAVMTDNIHTRAFTPGLLRFRPGETPKAWDLIVAQDYHQIRLVNLPGDGSVGYTPRADLTQKVVAVGSDPEVSVWIGRPDGPAGGHALYRFDSRSETEPDRFVPLAPTLPNTLLTLSPDDRRLCVLHRDAGLKRDELVLFDAKTTMAVGVAALAAAGNAPVPQSGTFSPDGSTVVTWRPGVGLQAFRVPPAEK